MGSVARVIKKTTKAVTKPLSKAFKGVAKGIKKVGKATMRGISKVNKKLGPIGSIALAIAMPYALGGLSSGVTALQGSQYKFLQAIGNVGNSIRNGYRAFNGFVGNTFSSITNSIKRGFSRFAPKGEGNIFSRISKGAKNLFQSAKRVTQKYSPIKGKQGSVKTIDSMGNVVEMTAKGAEQAISRGQTNFFDQQLGSNKWFVQGSKQSDKLITETINEAYKSTLDTYGPNAKRYFNDLKNKAIDMRTYVNDAEIGDVVNKYATSSGANFSATDSLGNIVEMTSKGATQAGKRGVDVIYDLDLGVTGDYSVLNEEGTEFLFNGNKTYGTGEKAAGFASKANVGSAVRSSVKSLLNKNKTSTNVVKPLEFNFGSGSNAMTDIQGTYGGTNISGAAGGNLLQGVFSDADRMKIMNYYKNMNILGSS